MRDEKRIEFGDWQTPKELAEGVVSLLASNVRVPASILEPTCGRGAFLAAAAAVFPKARLLGFDLNESYVRDARDALTGFDAEIAVADFFQVKWEDVLARLPSPVLVIGNPPWVTNSALGALDAGNLPAKTNFKNLSGLDAMTGKSNFDISEWMLLRLLQAANGSDTTLAMLCKAGVARKVMEHVASQRWNLQGSVHAIDARTHFAAAVDAVLLTVHRPSSALQKGHAHKWSVYESITASTPSKHMGVVDGQLCSDVDAYLATRNLEGPSEIEWRSGIKHDCARIMELEIVDDHLVNGMGKRVDLEREYVYPLLKGSDLANGRMSARRRVVVPQRSLGENTGAIRDRAPSTWAYLISHREHLDARKSSIYRDQPPFAIFGVGDYSFSPYKVAICGLYKRIAFTVIRPIDGQPVMVDDTAYFLPCKTEEEASELASVLNGEKASAFFTARIFWDAKRPINKALLQSLSLDALLRAEGFGPRPRLARSPQQAFAF
jgi:hypothetical protein